MLWNQWTANSFEQVLSKNQTKIFFVQGCNGYRRFYHLDISKAINFPSDFVSRRNTVVYLFLSST